MSNLQTWRQKHRRYCHQPDHEYIYNVGDVRICDHGKVQVGIEVLGSGSPYFRDLSPIANPILWQRAKRLIAKGLPTPTRYRDIVPPDMSLEAFNKPYRMDYFDG